MDNFLSAMTHQLFSLPRTNPLNNSAQVTPGARVRFYLTGTTTPTPAYTTSALSVAHTQPVEADATGRLPVAYLDPAITYKVTVSDSADSLLYTVDPVNDSVLSQAVIGAYLYPRTAAEIAAGVTPVNYAYPPGDIRRYGAIADGVAEDTLAFQNMLDAASGSGVTAYVPLGTYLIGQVIFSSNTRLLIESGTLILDTGVLQDTIGIAESLLVINTEDAVTPIQNVHIVGYGATVQLIRANYTSGEQRHCLRIGGNVDNITVEGLTCIDGGGDGFYIGGVGGGLALTPDNVQLIGCVADNNRRNGLSITAGRNIKIVGCIFANTNGTSPEKGVDIEPDQNGSGDMVGDLTDIVLDGCYSVNNDSAGFSILLPYDTPNQRISVSFVNCVSIGDNVNFQIEATKAGTNGFVAFRNCTGFEAELNGFDCSVSGSRCDVDGMRIFNCNQSGGTTERFGSSYSIYSVNATDGSTRGNVRIVNSYAYGTSALKAVAFQLVGEPTSVIRDVDIEVWTDAASGQRVFYGLTSSQMAGKFRVVFTDETEVPTTVNIGTASMVPLVNNIITNAGASGTVVLSLDDTTTRLPGVRVKARVKAAHLFVLDAGSGWTIGGGAALSSDTIGSEVTVESDGVSKWRIVQGGEGWHRDPIALDNTGTPSVSSGTMFETGGTTTITAFDDGVEGQEITVLVKHAITFDTTGTTLKGNAGVDITAASGDLLRGVYDGTNWRLTFSDCT